MIDIKKNLKNLKILTPNGFEKFDGIRRTKSNDNLKISFKDSFIIVTKNHRFVESGNEIIASSLKINDVISNKEIINIEPYNEEIFVYDILETESHTYIADGIVNHNCEFMGSSTTLLSGQTLKTLAKVPKNPIQRNEYIKQYEQPIRNVEKPELNHIYVMICDVSKGKGMDYSTFSIFDITNIPYIQVCTYRCNTVTPTDFATTIVQMGRFYNEAYVLVEINVGDTVPRVIKYDYDYENLLCMESAGRAGKRISSGFGQGIEMGIYTTSASKRLGCSMTKLLLEQNKIILYDNITVNEFSTFAKDNKQSYSAQQGFHDDMVMTVVIFAYITQDPYFVGLTDKNVMSMIRDKTEQEIFEELLPFGLITSALDSLEPTYVKFEGEKGLWVESDDDEFKW